MIHSRSQIPELVRRTNNQRNSYYRHTLDAAGNPDQSHIVPDVDGLLTDLQEFMECAGIPTSNELTAALDLHRTFLESLVISEPDIDACIAAYRSLKRFARSHGFELCNDGSIVDRRKSEAMVQEAVDARIRQSFESDDDDSNATSTALKADQVNAEMITILDRNNEAAEWTAAQFKNAIEKDGTKKTSEATIKKTTMWTKLMEVTGRGRKRRSVTKPEDTNMLGRLVSEQNRERDAENETYIKGNRVSSRD